MSRSGTYGKQEWIAAGVLAVGMAIGFLWWKSGDDARAEKHRASESERAERRAEMDALITCGRAISSAATYGKDNRPGYARGLLENGAWHFAWPHRSFHFKNAFGVDVPQSAFCVVNAETGRIEYLTISGKELIK